MSLLVGVIGIAGLMASRMQLRTGSSESDFAVARLCARAGLEIATYRMQNDPNWRTDLGNGAWFSNAALGWGNFSVSATDPITGDITVPSNHPVVLTCTGSKGSASYQIQVQVGVSRPGMSCLGVNLCAGSGIQLNSCTLTSNQVISSNGSISNPGNCSINAVSQVLGNFSGGGSYSITPQTITQPLMLPDPTHVFDYYKANGTAIPYTALYQSNQTPLVTNPSFETNINGWYIYSPSSPSVTMGQVNQVKEDGLYSLAIWNRARPGDVPAQDLPLAKIRNGDTYSITLPVYMQSTGTARATLVLQSDSGVQSFSTPAVTANANGAWLNCQGNLTLSWTGILSKATLTVTCSNNTAPFAVDKVSLTDASLPSNAYVMDRILLSPNSNPYGAPNSQGIYVIDCNNQPVTIGPCRIVGTLVLLNAGSNTTIQGPITWEPAVLGYPALLADKSVIISANSSVGLSEATFGVNFNPPGTPYPYVGGTSNTTANDGFPCVINGIIYCGGNVSFSAAPSINGCVVAAGWALPNYQSVNLTYNNASYVTPPPGFISPLPVLKPVPGSWQRVTH